MHGDLGWDRETLLVYEIPFDFRDMMRFLLAVCERTLMSLREMQTEEESAVNRWG